MATPGSKLPPGPRAFFFDNTLLATACCERLTDGIQLHSHVCRVVVWRVVLLRACMRVCACACACVCACVCVSALQPPSPPRRAQAAAEIWAELSPQLSPGGTIDRPLPQTPRCPTAAAAFRSRNACRCRPRCINLITASLMWPYVPRHGQELRAAAAGRGAADPPPRRGAPSSPAASPCLPPRPMIMIKPLVRSALVHPAAAGRGGRSTPTAVNSAR